MIDKTVIKIISKIRFIIVTAFSFIFILLFASFIALQNGFFIDTLSFKSVKIEKLYIKYNEKISLNIQALSLLEQNEEKDLKINYDEILKQLHSSLWFLTWFEEIAVQNISFKDFKGTLHYKNADDSVFTLFSPSFELQSFFSLKETLLSINIDSFHAVDKTFHIDGSFLFDIKDSFKTDATLNIAIGDETKLHLYASGDKNRLSYKIQSDTDIKNTREIVDLFDVDPDVKYWIYDAIKMSSLSLQTLEGWFEYENLDKAYLNLYAKGVANDLIYTYDQKVDSVRTKSTDLEFKDGVLYIKPQNAYSYNFFLDKSWLKIDFSKQEELLTLYLLFKGRVNKELLSLLERYEIKLPFIQNRGEVDTNLTLDINLITLGVEALGDFYAKEAQIEYLGLDIDISDANVSLENYAVKVKNMRAKYGDIASALVDLDFDAAVSDGNLSFRFDFIESKENSVALIKEKTPLEATYFISAKQDYLDIAKSSWQFEDNIFSIDSMHIPFDINTLEAKIPKTKVEAANLFLGYMSGDISFKTKEATLAIDPKKLDYSGLTIKEVSSPLTLKYIQEGATLSCSKPIFLEFDRKKIILEALNLSFDKKDINIKNLFLNFNDVLISSVDATYDFLQKKGKVTLFNIELPQNSELFDIDEHVELKIENQNDTFVGLIDKFDIKYHKDKTGWMLLFDSLEPLSKYSDIFKKYSLTNGYGAIQKRADAKDIEFFLSTNYKYKFLVADNGIQESYIVHGTIEDDFKKTTLKINNSIDVTIEDEIKVKTKDIGINLDEILNFMADKNSSKESKDNTILTFDAKDSYIYLSENRRAISDSIHLKYANEDIYAKLLHKEGKATFKLHDDIFHLYGEKFDDSFMEKLFSSSKFKGGSLEFYINGLTEEFSGVVYIKDTTILDYKILNNILAFVNTVPSLVTFSLPGYNINGIETQNAYFNFKYKDEIYNISNLYLKSKEIEIAGMGEASIKNDTIAMDLSLKTALGSSFSKIPLIGQILMGRENISATLTLDGKLSDPSVNTQITKDIAVMPFNIIKRTLMYPIELFSDEEK